METEGGGDKHFIWRKVLDHFSLLVTAPKPNVISFSSYYFYYYYNTIGCRGRGSLCWQNLSHQEVL